jgi:hypothetical protein
MIPWTRNEKYRTSLIDWPYQLQEQLKRLKSYPVEVRDSEVWGIWNEQSGRSTLRALPGWRASA